MSVEQVSPTRSGVWRGRISRGVSGLAVLGVTVVVVVAGAPSPGAGVDDTAATTVVPVPPTASTLVCAGPLIQPDDTGRGDSAFDPTPVDPVTTVTAVTSVPDRDGSSAGTVAPLDRSSVTATLEPGGSTTVVPDVTGPLVVRAEPGTAPARVAAASAGLVTAGDLRGLAAASCQQPTADAWLLGGASDLSSTAQLVLGNAGSTPAEVTLAIWGPSGPVDLTGERFLVAPGAQRVVVLGGIAAEQRRLALHVSATGGRVGVHVQDSAIDGFTPAGTDLVVPGAAPSRRQVVPGLAVAASTVGDLSAPALRLLAPGDTGTTARVTLLGPTGITELPGADSVALVPGEVTDVPLGGLPAGSYTAVVDADQPVLASAVLTRPGSVGELDDTPSIERAWTASTTTGRSGVVAVPAGTRGTLVAGAVATGPEPAEGGTGTATLRLLGADGSVLAERRLRLDAGTTGAWSVDQLAAGSGDVGVGDAASAAPASSGVAGVDLVTDEGARVAIVWALVAEVDRPDGVLVSVLDPVPVPPTTPDVAVREDPRLGTR